jgi:hypothetical protein
MGNRKWAMGNRKWAMGNRKWAIENGHETLDTVNSLYSGNMETTPPGQQSRCHLAWV